MDNNNSQEDEDTSLHSSLLTCAFNQDGGCLAIGTTHGFSIHNLHPYQRSVSRKLQGGIGLVEMLFRCNLIALVGGGPSPHCPPHRVLVWDDHSQKPIGELSFRQRVLGVKLRRDAIAVALKDRIYVYHLADLSLRDKIYTADNPHGLLSVNTTADQDMVVACPSVTQGHVRVELYGMRKTVLMEAHESALRGLALTANGSKLATASTKGTVIRVWNVATSTCLFEFRRGVERVQITCLTWSWNQEYLGCTSDKGTAHVFRVGTGEAASGSASSSSGGWLKSVRKTLEGESSRKSISQIRGIPHPHACAFLSDPPHTLAVVGWDSRGNGVLSLNDFSKEEATRIAYHVVTKSPSKTDGGSAADNLVVGERRVTDEGLTEISFTDDGENGFVSVTTKESDQKKEKTDTPVTTETATS